MDDNLVMVVTVGTLLLMHMVDAQLYLNKVSTCFVHRSEAQQANMHRLPVQHAKVIISCASAHTRTVTVKATLYAAAK
jgi:hypothetical protein